MHLAIVVPCYNEEAVLSETAKRLLVLLQDLQARMKVSAQSQVYFVDDGSRDQTWGIIESLGQEHESVRGIKLSRNRGHQNALVAGLFTAEGDAVVSIDADLQDDITVIEQMVDGYREGFEVVYGVRNNRDSDSLFKRLTAEGYYRLLRAMGVEAVANHADYRLLSRRALEALREYREINLFLRGIVPLLGFKSTCVYYARGERFAGNSKYPVHKMLALALEGITSFSAFPLRLITIIGFVLFGISVVLGLWVLGVRLLTEHAVPGWASTVLPVYFMGGVQLLCTGVIGEYLAKIYMEVKGRPRYSVDKII